MTSQDQIARLRISLEESEPEIWRRVEVPLSASLKALHDVIQAAMGWEDAHLWEFEAAGRVYGTPDPGWDRDISSAKSTRLGSLIEAGVREFTYVYDMGDNWQHRIAVEAIEAADPEQLYPRFIDGERRCPPEDVGGIDGFYGFVEAMSDPAHEEHEQVLDWYGEAYDPDDLDLSIIRQRVAALARRRTAGKAASRKSKPGP
jgi:hypothetical protein